jgi:hypothetical protein
MFRTLQSQYLETLYLSKVSDEVATRGRRGLSALRSWPLFSVLLTICSFFFL